MSLLARILETKAAEVARLGPAPVDGAPPVRDVVARLRRAQGAPLRLLTEVKLKSPSAGPLDGTLTPEQRALAYAEAGASLISVLCDGPFFGGAFAHLAAARQAMDDAGAAVPLLAKEFIVHPSQLAWARASGADAALLIVRILEASQVRKLVSEARALGLEPLVEITTEAELDIALTAGARLIGVNARDLDTLVMDAARAQRVLAAIPREVVALHLSGIKTPDDVANLAKGRADGALVGEILMRQADPRPLLRTFVAAAGGPSPSTPPET